MKSGEIDRDKLLSVQGALLSHTRIKEQHMCFQTVKGAAQSLRVNTVPFNRGVSL